jgi:hypothetical protein
MPRRSFAEEQDGTHKIATVNDTLVDPRKLHITNQLPGDGHPEKQHTFFLFFFIASVGCWANPRTHNLRGPMVPVTVTRDLIHLSNSTAYTTKRQSHQHTHRLRWVYKGHQLYSSRRSLRPRSVQSRCHAIWFRWNGQLHDQYLVGNDPITHSPIRSTRQQVVVHQRYTIAQRKG